MSTVVRLEQGSEAFVPGVQLLIDGRAADQEVAHDIMEVRYRDGLDELDHFQVTLNNWDSERLTFKYSDGEIFLLGKKIELSLGYLGDIGFTRMIRGVVTELAPTFPSAGPPALRVSGENILHRFRFKKRSVRYVNRKDSDIAAEIAANLNARLQIDSGAKSLEIEHEELLQDNEYDIVFLMKRARRNGYDVFADESGSDTVLRFQPAARVTSTEQRLSYIGSKNGRLLLDFHPHFSAASQVETVRVQGWNVSAKQPIKVEVGRQDALIRDPQREEGHIRSAVEGREEVLATQPVADDQEARSRALQVMTNIKQRMMVASGRTIGLPDLRAGSIVRIEGVGDRFSGRYFVTATEHLLGDNGYTTSFECRREEV
jgi:phage protein D